MPVNTITFSVEPTATGFSAASVDYAIVSVGATRAELVENLVEALGEYLREVGSPQVVSAANLHLVDVE